MRIMTTAGALLAMAGAAAAATIRVPQDQTTIGAAAGVAVDNDTILVAPGVYEENVTINANGVILIGAKGAVLDGNIAGVNGDCLTINGTGVTVQGLTFRHGSTQVLLNGADATVIKCVFTNAAGDAVFVNGLANARVEGCRFFGMNSDAIDGSGDGAVFFKNQVRQSGNTGINYTGNNVTVEGNLFFNIDDGDSINITGNNVQVLANRSSAGDGDLAQITGDDARVERNKARLQDGRLANITGNRAVVTANSALIVRGGVFVAGDNATVSGNKITDSLGIDGINVVGDALTITGNSLKFIIDDSDGIECVSATGTGGGLVEANRVDDAGANGFNLNSVFNLVVRANKASRCGTESESGFNVLGDANTLQSNQAISPDSRGFFVNGNTNTLDGCVSKGATTDGIQIAAGNANVIANSNVTGSGGEGLDNRGTNTQVQNGTYLKNRIDIANDAIGGATIVGGLTTVNFDTGGVGVQPEVD